MAQLDLEHCTFHWSGPRLVRLVRGALGDAIVAALKAFTREAKPDAPGFAESLESGPTKF